MPKASIWVSSCEEWTQPDKTLRLLVAEGQKSTPWGSHGGWESEKPVAVESTLAVSLSDSLGLVTAAVTAMPAAAAAPAAGETVAESLTWETGVVYKYAAKWLLNNTRVKDSKYL